MEKHIARFFTTLTLAGVVVLTAGCQTPSGWHKEVGRHIDEELKASEKQALNEARQIPVELQSALLPPLEMELANTEHSIPLERRFDLSVNNALAKQVFMGLVEGTSYSMVVDPKVTGRVSVKLQNVTVEEALQSIRAAYGYDYKRNGHQFVVYGKGMQTRMYSVNYLNLNRKASSKTQVSAGQLAEGGSSGGDSAGSNVSVTTSSDTDFWKDLEKTLSSLIGGQDRSVVINPQANLVVVRALPLEHSVIEEYLNLTQSAVNRQVVLEAKIIEIELNNTYQTGINWSKIGGTGSTSVTVSQVGGGTVLSGTGASNIAGTSLTLDPASGSFSPTGTTATTAFGGVFAATASAGSFSVFLEALKLQGDVHVLSSPRVSTVNNQKAVIKIGADEFFITGISTETSASGGTTTTTPSVELSPFFSGIALDVTPQIDEEGNIILHMHPTVSAVTQKNKSFTVQGNAFDLPLALTNIQEADNIVRADSGQIIVIGGLMKEASTNDKGSIPILGDIPLIGKLFGHQKITRIKKELVILLKPTIINAGQDWANQIGSSQERIEKLRR